MKKIYFALFISLIALPSVAQDDLIAPELIQAELIDYLQENYSVSNALSYNAARDAMFEDIDGKSGQITCVYTGYTISFTDRQDAQGSQAANDFNTEHIWPQSFFDSDLPMRSDIHHLYPTRVDVNGARSNFKFDEIPDEQTSTWYRENGNQSSIPSENINEFSELLSNTSFEPREDLKGNVARSIFYFWTIYQNNTSITTDGTDNQAFFNSMKDVLLSWHHLDPVDSIEVSRSIEIEAVQGNRNPFIHDTTLVRRAYFDGMAISNEEEKELPGSFTLSQNYPNPFNPATVISYQLAAPSFIVLKVFNSLGKEIATLERGVKNAGRYEISFDASSLPSGMYVYQLEAAGERKSGKMLLVK